MKKSEVEHVMIGGLQDKAFDWGRVIPSQEFGNPIMPFAVRVADATTALDKFGRSLVAAFGRMADGLGRSYRQAQWSLLVLEGHVTDRAVARTQYIDGPVVYGRKQEVLRQEVMQRCAGNRRRQGRRGR